MLELDELLDLVKLAAPLDELDELESVLFGVDPFVDPDPSFDELVELSLVLADSFAAVDDFAPADCSDRESLW